MENIFHKMEQRYLDLLCILIEIYIGYINCENRHRYQAINNLINAKFWGHFPLGKIASSHLIYCEVKVLT